MRIFRRNIAFLVPLAALVACETREATPTVVVDSAGVQVVTSYPLDSDATCVVGEEPLLVVGDREDDPDHLFGSVTGVARLSDGSVAVADRTVGEVRIFDATGEHLRSFGGFGDGPGEFRRPWYLWVRPGDTLWVGDYRPWRYNVFAADGQWSRAVQLDPLYPNPSRGGGVLSGGALIAARTTGMSESFETPDTLLVEVHDPDGKFVGVLARLPNMRRDVLSDGSGGDNMYFHRLFDSSASVSAQGDRIALGTSSEPEVRILDSEYRLTTIVRWDAGDRSVRSSDVDAFREGIRAEQAGRGELRPVDAGAISPRRPVADVFPAFRSVLLGNAGHLFVFPYRRPGQPAAGAMVFAPTGEFMCHMERKPGFSVRKAGSDYLLGVHLDELDVPTVKAYSFGPHAEGP